MHIARVANDLTVLQDGTRSRAVPGNSLDYLGLSVDALRTAFQQGDEPADQIYGPPLQGPQTIVCVALNYRTHAEESGMALPDAPLLFGKSWGSVVGPEAHVRIPRADSQLDYEAELAVVIGRPARRVPVSSAREYIGGYMCLNDISDRKAQLGDGQWFRGKNFPGAAAIGPWLVPAHALPDIDDAIVRCRVNGEVRQEASVQDMVFGIDELVSYCSHQFDLLPGDIIATGTPAGVGLASGTWLEAGDVVEVEVDGCGILRTHILPAAA